MKKTTSLFLFSLFAATASFAQCISINCAGNVSANNDNASCGAVVNYSAPSVVNNCGVDTFLYTGAVQYYTVPAGITTLTIEAWGAQGGANWVNNTNYGGYAKADFSVTPGEVLEVRVGQQPNGITGGYNGGGNGEGAGQGGGGASDVRQGGSTLNDRIIVGGGGGGAGYWSSLEVVGGVGGGTNGGDGYRVPDYATNPGGLGASQTGPGANGTCVNFYVTAMAGSFGQGGAPSGCGCEGYGGGGGWYGGAGSGNCRGGGGGSGYIIALASNQVATAGVRAGNGMVVISTGQSSGATVTQLAGLASGSTFPVGITTNTFAVSDVFGNADTCSFTVTVTDVENPVISNTPSSISVNNDAGLCGAVVSWTPPTATDNCSATLTSNYNSGDLFPPGTTTVTYTATDPSGNTATSSFTVTVTDTEAPVLSCPADLSISTDSGSCVATGVILGNANATDNCSVAGVVNDAPSSFMQGTTVVTWTATDVNGNSTTCTQNVTVTDMEAPSLVCPSDITVSVDPGSCDATNVLLGTETASDNCAIATVVNDAPNSFPAGTTSVTWTASDAAGNSTTCTQLVTVVDSEPPVISCTSDTTICSGVYVFNAPVASDNCSATVTQIAGPNSGDSLAAGNYTLSFSAVDPSGNMAMCSYQVTVNPSPSVSVSSNPTTICVDDAPAALSGTPAGGTWSGPGVTGSTFDPQAAGDGAHTLTYSVTGANSCTGSASFTITVDPCTGIKENTQTLFAMTPNPADQVVSFTLSGSGTLEIMDATGKLVLSKTISGDRYDQGVGDFADGVYTVRFTSNEGKIQVAKLMINH
ncbi:MAG TPA: HYR domain-containing protein [Bacteroidia bacterium]|nr:HYR domain-containing protein [Bacteroidia bacterium]